MAPTESTSLFPGEAPGGPGRANPDKPEIYPYQLIWLLVVPLTVGPLLVSDNAWYRLRSDFDPDVIPPHATPWDVFEVVDWLMILTTVAAGLFLVFGAPEIKRHGPRFRTWLVAAWFLFITATATFVGIVTRLIWPPGTHATGEGASDKLWLVATGRPFAAAGCYLLLAVIIGYALAASRLQAARIKPSREPAT